MKHPISCQSHGIKERIRRSVPYRLWAALQELRIHLFLFRLMPFSRAASLSWNRVCYICTLDSLRRRALNEKKHYLINGFLAGVVFETVQEETPGVNKCGPFPVLPIWVCWLQGEDQMPELNQLCVESIKRNAGKHPVIFLSERNIPEYLDIPQCVSDAYLSGRIKPAIYADYVRCALLYRYGGLWLDSTILLTKPLGEEWFQSAFMSVRMQEEDNKSVSRYRWATFCLGSVPGSPFFCKVEQMFRSYFEEVERNVDYLMIDYFFDLLCQKDPGILALVNQVPESNPALHKLRFLLNEAYDPSKMAAMEETTSIFKLSYKMDLVEYGECGQTFWGYLKGRFCFS